MRGWRRSADRWGVLPRDRQAAAHEAFDVARDREGFALADEALAPQRHEDRVPFADAPRLARPVAVEVRPGQLALDHAFDAALELEGRQQQRGRVALAHVGRIGHETRGHRDHGRRGRRGAKLFVGFDVARRIARVPMARHEGRDIALLLDEDLVEIDEAPGQPLREQRADGGLSGATGTDEMNEGNQCEGTRSATGAAAY